MSDTTLRVVIRLNMTLDADTDARLSRRAKNEGIQRARLARRLLAEGLKREDERVRQLAADYAAQRGDADIEDLAGGQLELLGDEEDLTRRQRSAVAMWSGFVAIPRSAPSREKCARAWSRAQRAYMADLSGAGSDLKEPRVANASMVMSYDKARVVKRAGEVSEKTSERLDQALAIHLGLGEARAAPRPG